MAAGGPGDHPLSDILNFNMEVYGEKCDNLIRQISRYVDINTMYEMIDWFDNSHLRDTEKFEIMLKDVLQELEQKAKSNGFEI